MAKATTKKTEATKRMPPKREKPKYGVTQLAEATGLKPASIRVALRAMEIDKDDSGQYGWTTKADFDKMVKALKDRSAKSATMKQEDPKVTASKGKRASVARKSRAGKAKQPNEEVGSAEE